MGLYDKGVNGAFYGKVGYILGSIGCNETIGTVYDNLGRIGTPATLSPNNIGKNRRHIKGYWEYIRIQVKHGQEMIWSSPTQKVSKIEKVKKKLSLGLSFRVAVSQTVHELLLFMDVFLGWLKNY